MTDLDRQMSVREKLDYSCGVPSLHYRGRRDVGRGWKGVEHIYLGLAGDPLQIPGLRHLP